MHVIVNINKQTNNKNRWAWDHMRTTLKLQIINYIIKTITIHQGKTTASALDWVATWVYSNKNKKV